MGLFDLFRGKRVGAPMRPENPSWILVEGGTTGSIREAVIEHSGITSHVLPGRHQVEVRSLGDGRFAVLFDPPAPPYAFANLIGWLEDPKAGRGGRRAVGWLAAPSDGTRYFLAPRPNDPGGDTLLGVSSDGRRVSVFLPDCSVSLGKEGVAAVPEPALPTGTAVADAFEVMIDNDTSFGNPRFDVG